MPKRSRRKGVEYIEEDRDRGITLSKRRKGLFKLANDLSILTDANVAVCLNDNNKVQFFGAPSMEPIASAFLSDPQTQPFADKQLKAKITSMQSELIQLESEEKEKNKKTGESIQRFKEVEEESLGTAKHLFSRAQDLSHNDIQELLQVLSPLQRDVKQRLPTIHRDTDIPMIPPPPAPGSPWSRIFPLRPPKFSFPSLVPSQQLPPVSLPQNTAAPPTHAPLVPQPLTNQPSAIPLLTQWQIRFGVPSPSEVQAYTPVEQPQNGSPAPAPAPPPAPTQTFSDNFLSELLADISDDGISPADPFGSPLIDNQLNGMN
uniref:MADS-box domain-containing protein n=1 Tax=Leersia perrieri TaxID=77586 RepID=A0A0D9WV97_9ORYZ